MNFFGHGEAFPRCLPPHGGTMYHHQYQHEIAEIEHQLRLQVGNTIFDNLPDLPRKPAHASSSGGHHDHGAPSKAAPAPSLRRPRRRSVAPDRRKSLERRRKIAFSGVMPPQIAAAFTVGELAALQIILDEIRDRGRCTLPLDIIAARAGVHRSTVRRALKAARLMGLISVTERRSDRYGVRSETNVILCTSLELRTWILRGGGRQKKHATDNKNPAHAKTGFGNTWNRYFRSYDPGDGMEWWRP